MKIALFSDIHANLPALEAVLSDIESRRPDAIFCLGDLVGYNIWPNEVIKEIRSRSIPTIAGNYDYGIGRKSSDCGCAYKTEEEKTMGAVSIAYTNEIIGAEEREYLHALPLHIRMNYQLDYDPLNVFNAQAEELKLMFVHGSPRRINEYLFEDRDEKSLSRIFEQSEIDILCFGHTHKPYHRILTLDSTDQKVYQHAINIGSVGKPKNGDPRASYVVLHIDKKSSKFVESSIKVDFIQVPYDIEKAAKAIENSPLPKGYADMLRRGI